MIVRSLPVEYRKVAPTLNANACGSDLPMK